MRCEKNKKHLSLELTLQKHHNYSTRSVSVRLDEANVKSKFSHPSTFAIYYGVEDLCRIYISPENKPFSQLEDFLRHQCKRYSQIKVINREIYSMTIMTNIEVRIASSYWLYNLYLDSLKSALSRHFHKNSLVLPYKTGYPNQHFKQFFGEWIPTCY